MTIPDLPDAILRHLFGYMSDPEVYFIMRGVSRRLRQFAEEYVEIGELIWLVYPNSCKKANYYPFVYSSNFIV